MKRRTGWLPRTLAGRPMTLVLSGAILLGSGCALGGCTTSCSRSDAPGVPRPTEGQALGWTGATSKETLVGRAVEAIRANDPEALSALIPSVSEMKRVCERRFKGQDLPLIHKRRNDTLRQVSENLAGCARLIDWDRARQQEFWGGLPQDPLEGCRDDLRRLGDITVAFDVAGVRFNVLLDNPFVLGGKRYGLLLAPSCERED